MKNYTVERPKAMKRSVDELEVLTAKREKLIKLRVELLLELNDVDASIKELKLYD